MSRTCSNCGKTGIGATETHCPTCRHVLSGGGGLVTGGPKLPMAKPTLTTKSGRHYFLNERSDNRIGRVGCAILLSDPTVPDHAATLRPDVSGGFFLQVFSPIVRLNGGKVAKEAPLQSGDEIQIGHITLTYSGPAAKSIKPPSKPIPPPPPVLLPFPLKDWGADPPTVEGTVQLHNGPHRLEDDQMFLRIFGAVMLGMIRAWLAMLPMQMRKEMHVWNYRVKDIRSGMQENVILIKKDPTDFISLGDFVAIWGLKKPEGIMLEEAYIYNTGAQLRVKKSRKRR